MRQIPKGIDPFKIGTRYPRRWTSISPAQFEQAADGVRTLLASLFLPDESGILSVPVLGINMVDIGAYLNHSNRPNLRTRDGHTFITRSRIAAGEELTVDYHSFGAGFLLT